MSLPIFRTLQRHCQLVNIIATCDNARAAIESIESLQPDLVFLDIEMPVMNGFLMLQQLQFRNFENSYIINKNFAERYIRGEVGQVVLSNRTVLDVSKRKKIEFLKAIGY